MEAPVDDQCINMEDLGPPSPPKFPDELRCSQIKSVQMEMRIFTARKTYVSELLEIEKETNGPRMETAQKSEAEMRSLDEKINILEAVKRTADPVIRPAKFTAKANNNNSKTNINIKNKNEAIDFVFPKKTSKIVPVKELEQLKTTNAFAALNTATVDAEDVSPPKPKIKTIFMKIIKSYNLILQELHRSYPTATNTHMRGYIKIEAQSTDVCVCDHRDITNYLKSKNLEHYVIDPPSTRPLKLVIKGLLDNIDPEDIKNDLISKGIKIIKIAQLKKFVTITPLPIYMIEIERDENVNDVFQVRSCLYMQIKLDPFRKEATWPPPLHAPNFPSPKKGKGKSPIENLKRNTSSNQVISGISNAQILNPNSNQQMATPGNTSSASNKPENNKTEQINLEALNAAQSETGEFGFLQAILENNSKDFHSLSLTSK
ncbi:UNVERIFIED_CONTAM: hypothetical protein NCL1_34574 [Trichonephila clavipes]